MVFATEGVAEADLVDGLGWSRECEGVRVGSGCVCVVDDGCARFGFEVVRIGVFMTCVGGWLMDRKPEGGVLIEVKLDVAAGGRTS